MILSKKQITKVLIRLEQMFCAKTDFLASRAKCQKYLINWLFANFILTWAIYICVRYINVATSSMVIIFLSCSTLLSMKFITLINVKMPTIVDILIFICMMNTTLEEFESKKSIYLTALQLLWAVEFSCLSNLSIKNALQLQCQSLALNEHKLNMIQILQQSDNSIVILSMLTIWARSQNFGIQHIVELRQAWS